MEEQSPAEKHSRSDRAEWGLRGMEREQRKRHRKRARNLVLRPDDWVHCKGANLPA